VIVALLLVAGLVSADDDPNDGDVKVSAEVGVVSVVAGANSQTVKPALFVINDMPLGFAVLHTRVGFTGRPAEDATLQAVRTFQAAELNLGLRHYFHCHGDGCVGIVGEVGFSSARDGKLYKPFDRLTRRAGIGFTFQHENGAEFNLLWGQDESSGVTFGAGDIMAYGRLPVPATNGIFVLNSDVTVSLDTHVESGALPEEFRDVWRVGATIDLVAVVKAIKGDRRP
jgi:hypothetical protein